VTNESLESRHNDLLHKFKLRGGLIFKDIEQELNGTKRPAYREESDTDEGWDTGGGRGGGGATVRVQVAGYGDRMETFTVDKHKIASQSEMLEKMFEKGSEPSLSMQQAAGKLTPKDTHEFLCPETFERFVK